MTRPGVNSDTPSVFPSWSWQSPKQGRSIELLQDYSINTNVASLTINVNASIHEELIIRLSGFRTTSSTSSSNLRMTYLPAIVGSNTYSVTSFTNIGSSLSNTTDEFINIFQVTGGTSQHDTTFFRTVDIRVNLDGNVGTYMSSTGASGRMAFFGKRVVDTSAITGLVLNPITGSIVEGSVTVWGVLRDV